MRRDLMSHWHTVKYFLINWCKNLLFTHQYIFAHLPSTEHLNFESTLVVINRRIEERRYYQIHTNRH